MRMKRPAGLNIGIDLVNPSELPIEYSRDKKNDATGKTAQKSDEVPGAILEPSPDLKFSAVHTENSDEQSLYAETGETRRRGSRFHAMPDPHVETGDKSSFQFLQGDGIAFLKRYRFTGSELVYCDPPYVRSTRTPRRLYEHEMTDVDHRRFLRVVMAIPARVMVSGYWSKMYADALKGWNTATFQAMTRGGRLATEWLWFNFPRPLALHDYRYLGRDFRERERIKRKTLRWTRRIERMPELEKSALLCAIAATAASGDPRGSS